MKIAQYIPGKTRFYYNIVVLQHHTYRVVLRHLGNVYSKAEANKLVRDEQKKIKASGESAYVASEKTQCGPWNTPGYVSPK